MNFDPSTQPVGETTHEKSSYHFSTLTASAAMPAHSSGLPLYFEKNVGQAGEGLDFVARGSGYTLGLSATEAIMAFPPSDVACGKRSQAHRELTAPIRAREPDAPHSGYCKDTLPPALVRMQLLGSNSASSAVGAEPLITEANYFLGNDPAQWHASVPTFGRVHYDNVYPGIDLVYHSKNGQLEYDFVVFPGADSKQIQLSFKGADNLEIDDAGNLVLQTGDIELRQQKPYLYQESKGARQVVDGEFKIESSEFGVRNSESSNSASPCLLPPASCLRPIVSFEVGPYDASRPLVIDPLVLAYSTYLGGSYFDFAWDVAVDSNGSAYVTGETGSLDFPHIDPIQEYGGNWDAFVTKLSPNGLSVVYSTYIGGFYYDRGQGIAVDASGAVYIAGVTVGWDFPTTPASFQEEIASGCTGDTACAEGFVTKLDPSGSSIAYSTFLGGTAGDSADDVAIDAVGNVYVKGMTSSANFPTLNAMQPEYGGGGICTTGSFSYPCKDAFVTKLNAAGSALVYSTYLGGNKDEGFSFGFGGIAVDTAGNAYVSGETSSPNFPSVNAVQPTYGGGAFDAFAAKLSAGGSAFVFSTFLGGNLGDSGHGIATDSLGNAYVVGVTASANFPTTSTSYQPTKSDNSDAFISKISSTGSQFVYSTFLGGKHYDWGIAIAVDQPGQAYLTGWTYSANFPTVMAFQPVYAGAEDSFVATLSPQGNALDFSSYLGGSTGTEESHGIALDPFGNAYVVGGSDSSNFPTKNAIQPTYAGNRDAFIAKVSRVVRQQAKAKVSGES